MLTIGTHGFRFHADEIVGCAVIILGLDTDEVEFIRSREIEKLSKADIVIDVGNKNEGKWFDHHAVDYCDKRPNGIEYASAGQMWKLFGTQCVENRCRMLQIAPNTAIVNQVVTIVDREFISEVDKVDTSGSLFTGKNTAIIRGISLFNRRNYYNSNITSDSQFRKAVFWAKEYLINLIDSAIIVKTENIDENLVMAKNVSDRPDIYICRDYSLSFSLVKQYLDPCFRIVAFRQNIDEKYMVYARPDQDQNTIVTPVSWRSIGQDHFENIPELNQIEHLTVHFIAKNGKYALVQGPLPAIKKFCKTWMKQGTLTRLNENA